MIESHYISASAASSIAAATAAATVTAGISNVSNNNNATISGSISSASAAGVPCSIMSTSSTSSTCKAATNTVASSSTGNAATSTAAGTSSTTTASNSAVNFNSSGQNSRKTSLSECVLQQQLPQMLQYLENGSFGEYVMDHHCPLSFNAKRHQEVIQALSYERHAWRIRERMKTASVALVLCLNIGVDPPDVVKIQPCSRLECWIDPSSVSAPKAMELIGSNLQMQYERWQPRARYKKCHDPTVDDVKKLCTSLRRNAKGERILFHYNGHGVPKPTANGEIWVFNKTFTQYIPLSIFELITWMAAPSIYVYDCSNAGIIINSFQPYAEQHERELEKALLAANQRVVPGQPPPQLSQMVSYKNCIHLAACSANEILPMNAQLPADLFTSCLTTPINIALKWYAMQEKLGMVPRIHSDLIDKIPGKVNDRRTMMGELNWVFTAITDTIAWNTLPRELFQRLFRQDLLVASLFRNFLLAERILRSHDCTPVSLPSLPPCFRHPMWRAWDLVVDLALQQLPDILESGAPYRQLPFFEDQLTAFQVWLDSESESRTPPEQLPIVLQVLLSQVHRLRALELLARFLDLGPWAVNLALGVGIFPYVLKLLQSSTRELRPVLVFIWAKILAVDPSCQVDLVKDHKYFLSVLQDVSVSKEHRTLSAFVLASIVNNFLLGQTSALQGPLLSICLEQLNDRSWLLRQWLAICLGMLWQNFEKARWSGVRDLAHEKLYPLLRDAIPEVRAAAVFALGTFISSVTDRTEEHANNIDRIIAITLLETVSEDMSPLVRLELASSLQWMVLLFESQFVSVYMQEHMNNHTASLVSSGERSASITHGMPGAPNPAITHSSTHSLERHVTMRRGVSSSSIANMTTSASASTTATTTIPFQSIFLKLWQGIYNLGHDPFPRVAETAQKIINYVRDSALCMITAKEATIATEKCISLSVSLPPSPNTRVTYLSGGSGDSPPVGNGSTGGPLNSITNTSSQHISPWSHRLRLPGGSGGDPQAILQRKLRTTSMNDETDSAAPSNAEGTQSARSSGSESNNYETSKSQVLKPIVQTEFIPWAISYFTRPGKHRYSSAEGSEEGQQCYPIDKNSTELRNREYRYLRNLQIRRQAKEQQQENRVQRLDANSWVRKTHFTPSIVKLLPYEHQIAVAYKEKVLIYDWQRNSVRTCTSESSSCSGSGFVSNSGGNSSSNSNHNGANNGSTPRKQGSTGSLVHTPSPSHSCSGTAAASSCASAITARVSSIEFLNAQDVGLVLVGHEDGVIRVWQSTASSNCDEQQRTTSETRLITAWDALPHASYGGSSSYSSVGVGSSSASSCRIYGRASRGDYNSSGIVTAWQQHSQHLVVGGGACRYLRIWDVERELKLSDLAIGRDETSVRVLSPFVANVRSDLIVAGCGDGSVRLFDKRCSSQEARIRVYREHTKPIMCVCLRSNQTTLVTGCAQGKVCVHDLRGSILQSWESGPDVTAIACHQSADALAIGNASKISIYSLNGRVQSVLRGNEGFMGSKIGHPTCLSFHTYKVQLAIGFVDNTVAVNSPTPVL